MPIYEYDCPKCGRFDAIQKVNDKSLKCKDNCEDKKCPKKAVRAISASSFHLKGGGWYKSDYSSTAKKTDSKSDSKSEEGSSSEKSSSETASADSGAKKDTKKKGGCGSGCGCH